MDAQTVQVHDKERVIEFTGYLLGDASSAEVGKAHWIDISIFKTTTGRYVVNYVGRTSHRNEVDRHTSVVSESPGGVVEALYLEDSSGIRYLTKVAKRALAAAATADPDLAEAFYRERI